MRILTLYQPYATLVMLGLKTFETRSWDAKNMVGETIGIHAAASVPMWCRQKALEEPFFSDLAHHDLNLQYLPLGKILGTVDIVNTVSSEMWLAGRTKGGWWFPKQDGTILLCKYIQDEWQREFNYGDYSADRFAFELANPRPFAEPIPAKGFQRWWNYDIAA